MKRLIAIIAIFVLYQATVSANDSSKIKIGGFVGVNYNLHTANFQKLRGIPNCCPDFENGSGVGFHAGVLFENNFSGPYGYGIRLGFISLDGELLKNEPTTVIVNSRQTDGAFEHSLKGSFMNVGIEPLFIYSPLEGLQLSAGPRLGMNLTSTYDQIETIVEPAGYGTFIDSLGNDTHMRTRNDFDGDIPDAVDFQYGLVLLAGYELPMNFDRTLLLTPELSFYIPFSEMATETQWRANAIRGSIAIKYVFRDKEELEEIFEKEYNIDTIEVSTDVIASNFKKGLEKSEFLKDKSDGILLTTEIVSRTDTIFTSKKYLLDGSITAVGVDSSGREIENPVFQVEEFISNRLDPLLNYVFFEENSDEIPHRYYYLSEDDARKFDVDSLYFYKSIEIYHNVLNIIGRRMQDNPAAKISLVGCNSDYGIEKGQLELSGRRALAVKKYLVDTWKISPDRIETEQRNLPERASLPQDEPDKTAENRRVEIYSDNEKILEPVFIEKIDARSNPPVVRFKQNVNSEAGIDSWELTAYQGSVPEKEFTQSGSGNPPAYIDWQLEEYQRIIPKKPEPVNFLLTVSDVKGGRKTIAGQTLPIEVITLQERRTENIGGYDVEKFNIILFEFDESNIEGKNKKIIEFISGRVEPGSIVEISGYTDRTGDEDYNRSLSLARAEATKRALGRPGAETRGIGEEKLLYDNELPEGRFYCRTVQVIVKTKAK
jgi:outer membrane protein OmpA-like peptidoglycan-associated protein